MPYVYRYDTDKQRPHYTMPELIKCVEREIKRRKQVYPGYVDTHRYSNLRADREIATMIEILRVLKVAWGSERLIQHRML